MDVQAILGGMFPPVASNGTVTTGNSSASSQSLHIIETVLPLIGLRGFAPVYRFAESALGWDPSYLLVALGFVWALNKLSQQVSAFYDRILTRYFMSSVHVASTDEIYSHVMAWLSEQPDIVNSRSIMAETVWKTAWEEEDVSTMGRDHSGLYLNFSNQEARTVSFPIII
jgi:mitochondrial chaperone BCS1